METYAEFKEKPTTDWHKELSQEKVDWIKLKSLSSYWVTCACGNQCYIIPRHIGGRPKDYELAKLGEQFDLDINHQDKEAALATLRDIEKRSALLMNSMSSSC